MLKNKRIAYLKTLFIPSLAISHNTMEHVTYLRSLQEQLVLRIEECLNRAKEYAYSVSLDTLKSWCTIGDSKVLFEFAHNAEEPPELVLFIKGWPKKGESIELDVVFRAGELREVYDFKEGYLKLVWNTQITKN